MNISYTYSHDDKIVSIHLTAENQAENFQLKGLLRGLKSESIEVDFVNHTGYWSCRLDLR